MLPPSLKNLLLELKDCRAAGSVRKISVQREVLAFSQEGWWGSWWRNGGGGMRKDWKRREGGSNTDSNSLR